MESTSNAKWPSVLYEVGSGADFGPGELESTARRRFLLWRIWNASKTPRLVTFIMLNPSTAGAMVDDPTIRRCVAYGKAWGFDGLMVVNLFSLRATDPSALLKHGDPVGILNTFYIEIAIGHSKLVVVGWGDNARKLERRGLLGYQTRIRQICRERKVPITALKLTKAGDPCHPLYLPSALRPRHWAWTLEGSTLDDEVLPVH